MSSSFQYEEKYIPADQSRCQHVVIYSMYSQCLCIYAIQDVALHCICIALIFINGQKMYFLLTSCIMCASFILSSIWGVSGSSSSTKSNSFSSIEIVLHDSDI